MDIYTTNDLIQQNSLINTILDTLSPGDSVQILNHTVTCDNGHIYNLDAKEIEIGRLRNILLEDLEEQSQEIDLNLDTIEEELGLDLT